MPEKDEILFPYEPPVEVFPGIRAYAPNINRAAKLFSEAKTLEEVEQAGKIFKLVVNIEVAQVIEAISTK